MRRIWSVFAVFAVFAVFVVGCSDDATPTAPADPGPRPPSTATATTVDLAAHPFAGPMAADLRGRLVDGGRFVVSTSLDGLCVMLDEIDLGCDAGGPVIPADAPPTRPRFAVPPDARSPGDTVLAYAYLPRGAAYVIGIDEFGRLVADGAVVNDRVWALPLRRGQTPDRFTFFDEDHELVVRVDACC